MADQKISQLTPLTEPDLTLDFIPIADGTTETKKINLTDLGVLAPIASLDSGTGFVGGILTGNTRGKNSLDIQSKRSGNAKIARGEESLAIGSDLLVTGLKSSSFGRVNEVHARNSHAIGELNKIRTTATESSVIGRDCDVSGARAHAYGNNIKVSENSSDSVSLGRNIVVTDNADGSVSVGNNINMSGENALAIGLNLDVSGDNSFAVGRNVQVNAGNVTEIGGWYSNGSRGAGMRLNNLGLPEAPTGSISLSLAEQTYAPLDGGAVHGNEVASALPREMFSMRRDDDELLVDVNITGMVKTVSLGDATRVGADNAVLTNRTSIGGSIQNVRSDTTTVNSIRQINQATYNGLVSASTVDANTVYIIVG
tara:strand:+ start:511 stop:1617 length:1107 start_codon:yes stop_codon:yes gene_type:complete